MGFTFKVETRKLSSLIKRLDNLDGREVEAGFFEEDRYGPENDNLPVATVAYYNEYGTTFNPTRPFMHDTFSGQTNQIHMTNIMKDVFLSALTNGRSVERFMRELGQMVGDIMQDTIEDYPGSNSRETIDRKGFNDPLVDTRKMLESVKFQIH